MKNYSLLKAQGTLELKLLDQFGNVIETCQHTNLVVNTGLVYIASRIKDTSNDVMSHMAIGTNNAATAATQSTLLAEVARVALGSTTIATTTVANDTVQYIATFDANIGTGPITEAATFNAASGGTMLCRTKFDVINKGPNDTLVITWKISLAAV